MREVKNRKGWLCIPVVMKTCPMYSVHVSTSCTCNIVYMYNVQCTCVPFLMAAVTSLAFSNGLNELFVLFPPVGGLAAGCRR